MTTNKPEVQQYSPISYGERSAWMQEDDFGGWVRAVNYEVLQAECEKLRNILSRVAEAAGGYADPSCSLEFMEEIPKEVESVVRRLVQSLAESRANDRQAMHYLNQVREIVGGDDFPDMVERCRELQAESERLKAESPEMVLFKFRNECGGK